MDPLTIGIISTIIMVLLLAAGVHVGIAMGAVSLIGMAAITNMEATINYFARSFYTSTSDYSFVVLPLFIIMGNFASGSGISEKAYDFASKWLSQLRGGLYLVTIAASAMFAATSGSSTATTLSVGKVVIPEMRKAGYNMKMSIAAVACSGTLGVLIPPSTVMVIYGICTEEPVGKLLIAGILPGILSATVYMIGLYFLVRRDPSLAPPAIRYTWKERWATVPGLWGIGLLFAIIVGGVYSGITTPNEAGALGAVAALFMLAGKKKGKELYKEIKASAWDSAMTVAMMFFIVITATTFTRFLTVAGVIDVLMAVVHKAHMPPAILVLLFIGISVVFGMFMSATAALLLIAPVAHNVLVPLGYDGTWLGIIMVKMFELAVITPPVGLNVYVSKSLVPEMDLVEVFSGVGVFVVMELFTVALLVLFPDISLFLVHLAFK